MKKRLRKEMRQKLLAMPPELAAAKSRQACATLVGQEEFRQAGAVMIFLSIPGEVQTTDLALACWQQKKTVLVPKVSWEHRHLIPMMIRSLEVPWTVGSLGVREPSEGEPWPLEDIDLIVVPALAYDRTGHRLGRGGGFYDRFLAQPQVRQAVTCGLGFDVQLLDELPVESHDRPVDMLVAGNQVFRFDSRFPSHRTDRRPPQQKEPPQ